MFAAASDFTGAITVNTGDVRQTIDGFGAADSGLGLDATKADLFFSTSSGIGLSLFRMEYASNSTGPTPYYPEVSTMATFYNDAILASARGALVWATPWSAMDVTWKDNSSFIEGNLLPGHYGDFATFCAGLQASIVANGGPTLYAMGVLNEPDFTAATYTSMQMTAAAMVTYITNNFGPAVAALSPRPLVVAPECFNWDNTGSYLSTLAADATAYSYIDVIATHQYAGTVAALNTTKKVWQTEMSGLNDVFDASMTHGLTVAGWIHSALTTGNVNAWHYWWARGLGTDNEGLIGQSSDDTITKRLYVLGNWSKFVRPGYVRLGTTGTVANLSLTAFRHASSGVTAVIAVNTGTATQVKVKLNGLRYTTFTPYITDSTFNLAAQPATTTAQGVLTMNLTGSSVTSFVGTGS